MQSMCDSQMAAAMAAVLAARNGGGRTQVSENKAQQMHMYLNKLKDMVPLCPKNRQVSKLEVIQHVIDYISDLQDTLQSDGDSDPETPPESPMDHRSFEDAFGSEDDLQKEHERYDNGQFALQEQRFHGYGEEPQYQQRQQIDGCGYGNSSYSSGSSSYGFDTFGASQRDFNGPFGSSHSNSYH